MAAQEYGRHPDQWHQPNFIDCIRSRKRPNGDIEQGHLSASLLHLGNTSYRVGNRQLDFGAAEEKFLNNDQANELLKPTYRKEYEITEAV